MKKKNSIAIFIAATSVLAITTSKDFQLKAKEKLWIPSLDKSIKTM